MKSRLAMVTIMVATMLLSCSQSDKEAARERADQAGAKATNDLHQLGVQAKADAQRLHNELAKGMNGDAKPSAAEAQEKLNHAGAVAKVEAEKAGKTLDHATVVARVKAKLASDVGLSSVSRVQVDYSGGIVTLRGSVMSADQKRLAEQAATQIEGVQQVRNELTVQP